MSAYSPRQGGHNITLFEKMPHNIPCAPELFKLARVTPCTFVVCLYLKQFMQCDRAIASVHFLILTLISNPKTKLTLERGTNPTTLLSPTKPYYFGAHCSHLPKGFSGFTKGISLAAVCYSLWVGQFIALLAEIQRWLLSICQRQ